MEVKNNTAAPQFKINWRHLSLVALHFVVLILSALSQEFVTMEDAAGALHTDKTLYFRGDDVATAENPCWHIGEDVREADPGHDDDVRLLRRLAGHGELQVLLLELTVRHAAIAQEVGAADLEGQSRYRCFENRR